MAYFEQLHSGIRILQPDDCFRMSTDSVLVANFLTLGHAMRIADLGCGSGNIAFLLAGRAPDCRSTGLELQPLACQAAQESVRRNALAPRVEILQADLRQIRTILPQHSFDAAVANPPYFPQGSGQAAASPLLAAARSEATCTLAQLLDAAAWLVKTGGRLALVYRPERLCDLLCGLRQAGFEPKRMRLVRHHAGAPVSLLLVESRRGGKPGLALEPDLLLFTPDGAPTAEYRQLYYLDKE